jgi:hypothetical protein
MYENGSLPARKHDVGTAGKIPSIKTVSIAEGV